MTSLTPRAQASLRQQISHARTMLAAARLDGGYTNIVFWLNRTNLLLDRLPRTTPATPRP